MGCGSRRISHFEFSLCTCAVKRRLRSRICTSRRGWLLAATTRLGAAPDLWQIQNRFMKALDELLEARVMDAPLRRAFESLAANLKISDSLLGWRP